MSRPLRHERRHDRHAAWTESLRGRPTLTLIKGQGKRPAKWRRRLVAVAVAFSGLAIGYRTHLVPPPADAALQNELTRLTEVYRTEGMMPLMQAKARLKLHVAEELKAEEPADTASGIAAYLFPELLPPNDFEREATQPWMELQRAIESSPRSERSRARFEELRAEIGIYEEFERNGASPVAREVLKLYEALSAP